MVDIATVSVVSSAVVALGSIATNFIGGERQRRHEAELDFETRVWERKSDALFTVIQQCRRLAEVDEPIDDENRQHYALELSKMLDKLEGTGATVEAFASSRCRKELSDLTDALRAAGVKDGAGARSARYWKMTFEASPVNDHTKWSRFHDWATEADQEAVADFAPDLAALQAQARNLMAAARESVRSPKD